MPGVTRGEGDIKAPTYSAHFLKGEKKNIHLIKTVISRSLFFSFHFFLVCFFVCKEAQDRVTPAILSRRGHAIVPILRQHVTCKPISKPVSDWRREVLGGGGLTSK